MSRKGMFGMEKNYQALRAKSFALRQKALDMVYRAKTGHIGGDFSVCDILNVLYNSQMNVTPENFDKPGHDHLILSKGLFSGIGSGDIFSVWLQIYRPSQQQSQWC